MSNSYEFTTQTGQCTLAADPAFPVENQCSPQTPQGGIVPLKSKALDACPVHEQMPDTVPTVDTVAQVTVADHGAWQAHCVTMSAMSLRKHYPDEANSHRNMLARRKRGAIVSPEFHDFRSFLRYVGPMPAKGATLDRIDAHDPEYAPGKVRWADKLTQTRNRTNTVLITPPEGGPLTASQLAARIGVSPDTVRKRRKRGWTDTEIISGKKVPAVPAVSAPATGVKRLVDYTAKDRHPYTGWWFSLLQQYQPSPEDISYVEHWLFSRREPKMQLVARDTAARMEFKRRREESERDGYIGEPIIACWGEMVSDHPDLLAPDMFDRYTEYRDRYDRHFLKSWKKDKPYVRFSNLNPLQLEQITRVDPDYVRQQEELARRL